MAEIKFTKITVELTERECAFIENALRNAEVDARQMYIDWSKEPDAERFCDRLYDYVDGFAELAFVFRPFKDGRMNKDIGPDTP